MLAAKPVVNQDLSLVPSEASLKEISVPVVELKDQSQSAARLKTTLSTYKLSTVSPLQQRAKNNQQHKSSLQVASTTVPDPLA